MKKGSSSSGETEYILACVESQFRLSRRLVHFRVRWRFISLSPVEYIYIVYSLLSLSLSLSLSSAS